MVALRGIADLLVCLIANYKTWGFGLFLHLHGVTGYGRTSCKGLGDVALPAVGVLRGLHQTTEWQIVSQVIRVENEPAYVGGLLTGWAETYAFLSNISRQKSRNRPPISSIKIA